MFAFIVFVGILFFRFQFHIKYGWISFVIKLIGTFFFSGVAAGFSAFDGPFGVGDTVAYMILTYLIAGIFFWIVGDLVGKAIHRNKRKKTA